MSEAMTIRNAHQLAGHVATAAHGACCSYELQRKFNRETFTFSDGSKIIILNNRTIKVE